MLDFLQWPNRPPPAARKFVPVLSPKPGKDVRGFILAKDLTGVMTHFRNGNTQPCFAPVEVCLACKEGLPKRWKGYLPIQEWYSGRVSLLELTEQAVRSCRRLWEGMGPLTGYVVNAVRQGKQRNSPVHIQIEDGSKSMKLPPPCDVHGILLSLWGVTLPERGEDHE